MMELGATLATRQYDCGLLAINDFIVIDRLRLLDDVGVLTFSQLGYQCCPQ